MTKASVVIAGLPERAEMIRSKLPFASVKQGKVLLKSQLESDLPLNDHLVWLWGMLKHQRRFLKTIQTEGAKLVCECETKKGSLSIKPNGAQMLHLLDMELVLEIK